MMTRQLPAHCYTPLLIMVLLFTFCGRCNSTAVAVLQSKKGFVILADSKEGVSRPNQTICRGGEVKKVFIVQDRFAIAAIGMGCVHGTYEDNGVVSEISYNINSAWVQELQSSLPKNASLEQFVK